MKNKISLFHIILFSIYIVLFSVMLIITLEYHIRFKTDNIPPTKTIKNVNITYNNKTQKYTLPYKISELKPRSKITVEFKTNPIDNSFIYLKTVYAPIKVYVNNELIYEYGTKHTYPKFMKDPPTKTKILELPHTNQLLPIKIEYFSPVDRDSLMIHPFFQGHYNAIRDHLISKMGLTFLLAITILLLGILLIFVGIITMIFEKKSISFIWLGLFSLLTGLFSLGECNLTQLYTSNALSLYILDFCTFFILPIPLIEFAKSIIDFKNVKFLNIVQLMQGLFSIIAMLQQAFCLESLYSSLYIFIILSPISLIILAFSIINEAIKGNKQTKHFIFPIAIVALSAIIEAINYKYRFISTLSACFMMGVAIFILLISIRCAFYLREIIDMKNKTRELKYDLLLMKKQVLIQKEYNNLILKNAEILKSQRHDLRHQLAVIQHYNQTNNTEELAEYLNTLIEAIPNEHSVVYCENQAVNAIIVYYLSTIGDTDINTTIELSIPDNLENVNNNDLCIIIGNLFENAIEACKRMCPNENKFIKLSSRIQYDTLTITQDNSFNGNCKVEKDTYISSKRNAPGIGLNSIKQICEKYNGGYRFETKDNTFMSSVYIKI